jgi:hypothetical protein
MNATLTKTETPDELDRLLSDFFKAQFNQPWPKAPTPAAAATEPSELVTARTASAPRNEPAPTRRDNTARARFTLAASVAVFLGASWLLSNGFQPGTQPVPTPNGSPSMFDKGVSKDQGILPTIQKNKALDNDGGFKMDPVKIGDVNDQ